jgi:hypothetical protein
MVRNRQHDTAAGFGIQAKRLKHGRDLPEGNIGVWL